MRNQGIFRILFSVLLISYIEIVLEAMISRLFPTQLYHVVFQLAKKTLDVTAVLLVYMDKLFCSNSDSDQEAIMEQYQ